MEDSALIPLIHLFVNLTGKLMTMLTTHTNTKGPLEVMESHGLLTCQQTSLIKEEQDLFPNMESRNISILQKLSTIPQVLITPLTRQTFLKLTTMVITLQQAHILNMHLPILMMRMNEENFIKI
jgi:hypothetical protein